MIEGLPQSYSQKDYDMDMSLFAQQSPFPAEMLQNVIDMTLQGRKYALTYMNPSLPTKREDYIPTPETPTTFNNQEFGITSYRSTRSIGYNQYNEYIAHGAGTLADRIKLELIRCGTVIPMIAFNEDFERLAENTTVGPLYMSNSIEVDLSADPEDEHGLNHKFFQALRGDMDSRSLWAVVPVDVFGEIVTAKLLIQHNTSGVVDGYSGNKEYRDIFGVKMVEMQSNDHLYIQDGKWYDGYRRGIATPSWGGDEAPFTDFFIVDATKIAMCVRMSNALRGQGIDPEFFGRMAGKGAGFSIDFEDKKGTTHYLWYLDMDVSFNPSRPVAVRRVRCFNPAPSREANRKANYEDPLFGDFLGHNRDILLP